MSTDLHKRKRHKNLAVLAIVLGWVALIWFVTMARLAHGADLPFDPYAAQRTAHQAAMDDTAAQMKKDGTAFRAQTEAKQKEMTADAKVHQQAMDQTRSSYDKNWQTGAPGRASAQVAGDAQRAAHQQVMATQPQSWWQDWLSRHKL